MKKNSKAVGRASAWQEEWEELISKSHGAEREMWHFDGQKIRDTRRGGMEDSGHVVRECKAMAEQDVESEAKNGKSHQDFMNNADVLGRCFV